MKSVPSANPARLTGTRWPTASPDMPDKRLSPSVSWIGPGAIPTVRIPSGPHSRPVETVRRTMECIHLNVQSEGVPRLRVRASMAAFADEA